MERRVCSTIRSFFPTSLFPSSCALIILYWGLLTDALWPLFQILVRKLPDGRELWGRIVETEAYLGGEDEASHSKGGKQTQRNAAMFMKPGTLYVYQIYGIYFCVNVSSQGKLRLKSLMPIAQGWYELPMGSVKSMTCCHNLSLGPGFCHCEQYVAVDRQCINFQDYK